METIVNKNGLKRDARAAILAHWAWYKLQRYIGAILIAGAVWAILGLVVTSTSWWQS